MTIKKLTAEGRFEAGIDEAFKGKLFAFTEVMTHGKGKDYPPYGLGIAVANEAGYTPVPVTWAHGDDYNEMAAHAEELNLAMGLDPMAAVKIVCSSMAQGKPGTVET